MNIIVILLLLIIGTMGAAYVFIGMERIWVMVTGEPDLGAVDFQTLQKTPKPNQFLMCPAHYCGETADAISPNFSFSAQELQQRFHKIAQNEPNVVVADYDETNLSARYVTRSPFFKFPDTTNVKFIALEDGGSLGDRSTLAIYAQAQLGHSDLGANKARIEQWIRELEK